MKIIKENLKKKKLASSVNVSYLFPNDYYCNFTGKSSEWSSCSIFSCVNLPYKSHNGRIFVNSFDGKIKFCEIEVYSVNMVYGREITGEVNNTIFKVPYSEHLNFLLTKCKTVKIYFSPKIFIQNLMTELECKVLFCYILYF